MQSHWFLFWRQKGFGTVKRELKIAAYIGLEENSKMSKENHFQSKH